MTGTKGAATLGELLNPAAWARRLARGLGTDAADDLAQEALVRALERPPVGK